MTQRKFLAEYMRYIYCEIYFVRHQFITQNIKYSYGRVKVRYTYSQYNMIFIDVAYDKESCNYELWDMDKDFSDISYLLLQIDI